MKIIHCADIHLDSQMTSNLDKSKARERKFEILETFRRMIEYAEDNDIFAILIAGDLFDTKNFSASTRNSVIELITVHERIRFYFLKGNHGGGSQFIDAFDSIPDNLYLFGNTWTSYSLSDNGETKIVLSGIELDASNSGVAYSSLMLEPRDFNIVTMHGQISSYQSGSGADVISLSDLRNKNIDYLALGHVHEYQIGDLPPRGKYCYCGCLEGRGFDECGKHGFVVVDINEETHEFTTELIPVAKRSMYEVHADISDCKTTPEIRTKIDETLDLQQCEPKDMIKIVLDGEVDVECEKNIDYLAKAFSEKYYFVKVQDKTRLAVDYKDFELDASLKGEFVRVVKEDNTLSEDEKAAIIRCGFQALNGEEFTL